MDRIDRLTTLIDKFRLTVTPAPLKDANLLAVADPSGAPDRVVYCVRCTGFAPAGPQVLFSARVEWSGEQNPLVRALPDLVDMDLQAGDEGIGLVQLMQDEITAQRCGANSVLSRLGEVLIVRMMRAQIAAGSTAPGLLAGLSDPRLSRAIVAMHDRPGQSWRNEDLAARAGMSLSRFAEKFLMEVGETPAAYLRRWRLTLARQDIAKGHRVETVARRYGFASAEGFSRAFKKQHGATPITLRQRDLVSA
ncbi:MAG: AraC family transcriptional regulator [Pseudomonadota bacterium]